MTTYLLGGDWNITVSVTEMPYTDGLFGDAGMDIALRAEFLDIMTSFENDDIRTELLGHSLLGTLLDNEKLEDAADYIKNELSFYYQEALAENTPLIVDYVRYDKWKELSALLASYSGNEEEAGALVDKLRSEYEKIDALAMLFVSPLLKTYSNTKYTNDFERFLRFVFANPDSLPDIFAMSQGKLCGNLATLKSYLGTSLGQGEGTAAISAKIVDASPERIEKISVVYALGADAQEICRWTVSSEEVGGVSGIKDPVYSDVPYWASVARRDIDDGDVQMRLHQTGSDSFKLVVLTSVEAPEAGAKFKTEIYTAVRDGSSEAVVTERKLDGEWNVEAVLSEKELPPEALSVVSMLTAGQRGDLLGSLAAIDADLRKTIFSSIAEKLSSDDRKAIANQLADTGEGQMTNTIIGWVGDAINGIQSVFKTIEKYGKLIGLSLDEKNWDTVWTGFKVSGKTYGVKNIVSGLLDLLGLEKAQRDVVLDHFRDYNTFQYFWKNTEEIEDLLVALMSYPDTLRALGEMDEDALTAFGALSAEVLEEPWDEKPDIQIANGSGLMTLRSELASGKELLLGVKMEGTALSADGNAALLLLWETLGEIPSADYRFPMGTFQVTIEDSSAAEVLSRDAVIEIHQASVDRITLYLSYLEAPAPEAPAPEEEIVVTADDEVSFGKLITHRYTGTRKKAPIVDPVISDDVVSPDTGVKPDEDTSSNGGGGGGGGCSTGAASVALLAFALLPFLRKNRK
ncbi:hypothetical protein LJC40_03935 [Synergistaceae bacterium OttesenSCG-928-D05]|nr:hypothetical protein [Synergistaceae bacterium OttesenSCG-928-D05]